VFLAIASLYYMPLHPRTCSGLYSISCLLDALDGYAARRYNQSTTFGAVLDMVTDRCTTACLLVFLASAWPRWSIVFQGLISLDLASHYMHMYASLSMGGGQSHKKVDSSRSYILHLYYTNRVCPLITSQFSLPLIPNPLYRPYSSFSALLTNSSLSPSTSSHSPRHYFPPPFSSLTPLAPAPLPSLARLLTPVSSSTPGALVHWKWRALTRWTQLCLGFLSPLALQLCWGSRSSM
jgi:CDP-diacylglycerol--inositol 3-phosphatidyltransferase